METQFRNLDRAIDSQPMPPQFQDTKAMVSCNDCYAKSVVKYHWLGLKCGVCDSYNTAQLSILSDPEIEIPTIEADDADDGMGAEQTSGEDPSPNLLAPVPSGPIRHMRRHSSHTRPSTAGDRTRFSPYPLPQRIGRSVSPLRVVGFFDNSIPMAGIETDESVDEDELDFWGRDEPRSVTSGDMDDDEMEDEEESDDDSVSAMDECDEDGEEEDQFEIFGHR